MMVDYINDHIEGKRPLNKEYRIIRKNDKVTRWLHFLGNLYYNDADDFIQILGTIQDITKRKLLEEERKMKNINLEHKVIERTEQLQHANQDLEAFAFSISHDLRAPLRHIDGFLQLMYNAIKPVNGVSETYFRKIESATKNMSVMIDQLLKFSRLGRAEFKFTTVDISKLIAEVIEQFKPDYADRNIQWKVTPIIYCEGRQGIVANSH